MRSTWRQATGERGAVAAWVALVLGACSAPADPEPSRTFLAAHPDAREHARASASRELDVALPAEVWETTQVPGVFRTDDPLRGTELFLDRSAGFELRAGPESFALEPHVTIRSLAVDPPAEDSFYFFRERLYLVLNAERELPDGLLLRAQVRTQQDAGGRARVLGRVFTADGFTLEAGEALTLPVDLPEAGVLLFEWRAVDRPGAREPVLGPLRVDGPEPASWVGTDGSGGDWTAARLALPAGAARLSFSFEGSGCTAFVRTPRVLPAAETPRDERPDLVLFVADTLRADALGAYGGEREVSPQIDALAAEGAVFERAWSPSSWTLPAHASLFTGVFPYQHGARRRGTSLGTDLVTLGEHLRDAGYRTGGMTDGLFLSHRFGLDRGFETFVEGQPASLERTLEGVREFLDGDDGRPFFLLVHSYHAHGPYLLQEETVAEHGERLGIEDGWETLMQRAAAELAASREVDADDPNGWIAVFQDGGAGVTISDEIEEGLHRIYLARVLELDGAVGELRREFERRGLDRTTNWLFTSDHGEAFGEHGNYFHGHGVWDEVLRIPLFLTGPDVEPRRVPYGASLIDVPHTLCDLAGVEPAPGWLGRSLLRLDRERPVFSFDCSRSSEPMAIGVRGEWKLAGPVEEVGAAALDHAYDLAEDPAELRNLAGDPPPGVAESWRELATAIEVLLEPAAEAQEAALDAEAEAALRAMGYAGGE